MFPQSTYKFAFRMHISFSENSWKSELFISVFQVFWVCTQWRSGPRAYFLSFLWVVYFENVTIFWLVALPDSVVYIGEMLHGLLLGREGQVSLYYLTEGTDTQSNYVLAHNPRPGFFLGCYKNSLKRILWYVPSCSLWSTSVILSFTYESTWVPFNFPFAL